MTDPSNDQWRLWGPLADRYREPRPRKILALDGGGIRGVITLGVLKHSKTSCGARVAETRGLTCPTSSI